MPDLAPDAKRYVDEVTAHFALDADLLASRSSQLAGDSALDKGRTQDAIAAYERAVALGGDNYQLWMSLSTALKNGGRPGDALAAAYNARLAADQPADKGAALFAMAGLLDTANRAREAIEAYQTGLNYAYDDAAWQRMQALQEAMAFRVLSKQTRAEGDTAELCLRFRSPLKQTDAVHYEDYLKIEPAIDAAYHVSDDTLCASGLGYGANYKVTVLKGLPSIYDEKLDVSEEFSVSIGDRAPSVGFSGYSYILPKVDQNGIPLVTVNVNEVKLRLLRITDRNLVQQIYQGRLFRGIDGYETSQLRDEMGEELWSGQLLIDGKRNQRSTTSIPISEVLPETKPGIYALIVETSDDEVNTWNYRATQWFVISDLGLTTASGTDGLHVFVRSLTTGEPVPSVALQLFARNNEALGEATTDLSGAATFAPGLLRGDGGKTATALMARTAAGDFVFIDMTRAAFDLSDRGVGGRLPPGATDAFMYTDRGVYRPGEIVHLMALVRNNSGYAEATLPVTFELIRPDGVVAEKRPLTGGKLGGYQIDLPMSPSARTGTWAAYLYVDPKAAPVGSVSFQVEEVVPARIELKLKSDQATLKPDATALVTVDAQYLYGAPASDLQVKSTFTVGVDYAPFAKLMDYTFTLADESVPSSQQPLEDSFTDATGRVDLAVTATQLPDTPQPLKGTLNVEVYEFGGRPVIESIDLPIRNRDVWLGIKPLFSGNEVAQDSSPEFEVVAVNGNGEMQTLPNLKYRLIQEDWDYQWYYSNGYWDYNVSVRDGRIQNGDFAATADKPAKVGGHVDWGSYRLEVFDPASGAASSYRFYAGWYAAPGTSSTPDKLQVSTDKELYGVGDVAHVAVKPPFAGKMTVLIATDHVLETRMVDVPAAGTQIDVPVDPTWGAGAYVLATAYRPDGGQGQPGPGRAIGVAWLGVDTSNRTLKVALQLPDNVSPRQTIDVPVTVTGASSTEAYITVAAVDEGILQLTDFVTPDPVNYLFGKRQLGLEVRDIYGSLIDGRSGKRGTIRTGGDAMSLAKRGAPPTSIQMVALFSGIVKLNADGTARVPLTLPDFNGRLRLMAVAYDAAKVGAGEGPLIVRDPVVVLTSTPRFLASGDQSEIGISMQNVSGAPGLYEVTLASDGPLQLTGAGSLSQNLSVGSSANFRVNVKALGTGLGQITMAINGPQGFRIDRTVKLGVRAPQLPILERTTQRLDAGKSLTLNADALARFVPGSGEIYASVAATPNLDVPGLLRSLDRYPYGCLEQTTSRALPLLYVGDVADLWRVKDSGGESAQTLDNRIENAVFSVIERQRYDGGFGLWWSGAEAEAWLSGFAMEFLLRAKEKGHYVPDAALDQGLKWLDDYARSYRQEDSYAISSRAYAHYVLARAGRGDLSGARYLFDNYGKSMPSALAAAQLGAALATLGDKGRAEDAFKAALVRLDRERRSVRDYGSSLRDLAAVVTLMLESGVGGEDPLPLVERLAGLQFAQTYLSTQEQAWLIMAAKSVAEKRASSITVSLNGVPQAPRDTPLNLKPNAAELAAGLQIANAGDGSLWAVTTIMGAPEKPQPAMAEGFSLARRYYNLTGQEVTIDQVKQTDMFVVVLEGSTATYVEHQALIVDLLPAGFEVENARLADAQSVSQLSWLPEQTPTVYTEFLDDRFVAALDLGYSRRDFRVAYLVRAVTPGSYSLPAAEIEDMYQPQYRARTATGRVTVTAAQ
ncbi:MAG TPA: MG2 domain-containing protein [Verrucomicrobiae bacterium]|nr:MG2 domain-containing protein [Verrucomicrobiae bacterium]